MTQYVGICPHPAGFFSADEEVVEAESIVSAVEKIRVQMWGTRYLSRVIRLPDMVEVWNEAKGVIWNEAANCPMEDA